MELQKLCLVIEYDGAGFRGWQRQVGVRTVQEELEKVICVVLGINRQLSAEVGPPNPVNSPYSGLRMLAAGRTDAGVHARGQVVSFYVPTNALSKFRSLEAFGRCITHLLRGEVSVLQVNVIPDSLDVRGDAVCKQYLYRILNRPMLPTLDRHVFWHVPYQLNVPLMQDSASALIGTHDFTSFRGPCCQAGTTTRNIFKSQILQDGETLIYQVIGDGFLKQMVRNIVGTLVQIGSGKLNRSILEILELRSRKFAGVTAPAHGLVLDWVKYPPNTVGLCS